MATTVQSRKAKGRKLQQEVVKRILTVFPDLTDRDCRSTSMGVTGEDVALSEAAYNAFPYSVECKACESLAIWASLKQAEDEARRGTPLLVFKRNHSDIYCALKLDDFMKLLQPKVDNA